MTDSSQKPITKQDLVEFTEETILPAIEKIIKKSENRILNSNEKIAKEIIAAREEQAAIHLNYQRIDSKVEKHEDYIEKADKKLKLVLSEPKFIYPIPYFIYLFTVKTPVLMGVLILNQ
jgi:predicted Mrr-cat superfamily restriction endonuclease